MQKNIIIAALAGALAVSLYFNHRNDSLPPAAQTPPPVSEQKQTPASTQTRADNAAIEAAFRAKRRNVWVEGAGEVKAVLADDNKGSRHQRFILTLDNGMTLLFAHNIDLAPRLPALKKGDAVAFRGEYIYNTQGGIIHWTHHDPQRRHEGGWLRYRGETYR
ncbi:MAG: DUF3465 domain-containing protein [Neisseria sp.]|nr:DUF3465 domain-containing protein [Neisseria sp.]